MELFSPPIMSERESLYTPLYENDKNERVKLQWRLLEEGKRVGGERSVQLLYHVLHTPVTKSGFE